MVINTAYSNNSANDPSDEPVQTQQNVDEFGETDETVKDDLEGIVDNPAFETMTFDEAKAYDTDGNDHIDLHEFTTMMNDKGITDTATIENLFGEMDGNSSGRVGDNEWSEDFSEEARATANNNASYTGRAKDWPDSPPQPDADGNITFEQAMAYDRDGNEHLDRYEFGRMMNDLGVTDEAQIDQLFAENDPDGSGRSGDDDWVGNFSGVLNNPTTDDTVEGEINAIVNPDGSDTTPQSGQGTTVSFEDALQYDTSGNGHIESDEFTALANDLGITDTDTINSLFAQNDQNGSGRIGDDEWIGDFSNIPTTSQNPPVDNDPVTDPADVTDPVDETDPVDVTDPVDETDPVDVTDPVDETDPADVTDPAPRGDFDDVLTRVNDAGGTVILDWDNTIDSGSRYTDNSSEWQRHLANLGLPSDTERHPIGSEALEWLNAFAENDVDAYLVTGNGDEDGILASLLFEVEPENRAYWQDVLENKSYYNRDTGTKDDEYEDIIGDRPFKQFLLMDDSGTNNSDWERITQGEATAYEPQNVYARSDEVLDVLHEFAERLEN
jgi:Ca2+-binding EF-hand superfamily protein